MLMQRLLGQSRKAASLPSPGRLSEAAGRSSGVEMPAAACSGSGGAMESKTASQAQLLSPFSPVFDLELEAKRGSSSNMERCFSEHFGDGSRPATLLQQILALCRCTSPIESQLLQQLQHLRSAAAAAGEQPGGACLLVSESSVDIEAMACELLASGFLVQVRDGAQQQERGKTARSCLQNLRHRFIVCLGWRSSADAEPGYLAAPVIVEPRFREQFAIAHPTQEYEALLQAVPPCFVGPVSNLESIVKLLCEQMVITFKQQGLPVPPWRTRSALLSKWCPGQLAELAAKIAKLRRLSSDMAVGAVVPVQSHERLCNGARPAAAHAPHAAVGSAPLAATQSAEQAASASAFAAASAAAMGGPQQPTHEQVLAMLPPEMQQQLLQDAALAAAGGGLLVPQPEPQPQLPPRQPHHQQQLPALQPQPAGGRRNGAPCPAAAGGSGAPLVVSALPVGGVHGGYSAAGPMGTAPSPAAADVLALLEAADSLGSAAPGCSTLKFTRKASAEWKNSRADSRNAKGLLAAALGGGARSLGGAASAPPATDAGGVQLPVPPAALLRNTAASASAACGAGGAAAAVAAAAAAAAPAAGAGAGPWRGAPCAGEVVSAGGGAGSDAAFIRRTHYRTSGEEPWRRITTVRWGAYAQQQGPGTPAAASGGPAAAAHAAAQQQRVPSAS